MNPLPNPTTDPTLSQTSESENPTTALTVIDDIDAAELAAAHVAETTGPRPWDRQPGESQNHYVWFLVYLNSGFGSARSVAGGWRAFQSLARSRKVEMDEFVSDGRWREAATKHHWKDRAFEYDVAMLAREGAQAVVAWVSLLRVTAQRALTSVANNPDMHPRSFGELMHFLQIFGEFIPAESVAALQDTAADNQTPGIGS